MALRLTSLIQVGALVGGVMLLATACERKETPATEAPLAMVNGKAITEQDFDFEVQRRVSSGRPLGSPGDILQELIERQVMLDKAAASGVLEAPEVRRELENRQLGQWLDRTLQIERDAVSVSDAELGAYYEAEMESFTRPALARLAILYRRVAVRDGGAGEDAGTIRAELEKARSSYLADPNGATQQGRLIGFGTLAAQYSEDTVSRYRGGDLGWIEVANPGVSHPPDVIAAGLALGRGGVSDVMTAGDGMYVVMKVDEREARVAPFEEVAPGLRRKLIKVKQEEVERTFKSNLLAEATVAINREKADALQMPTRSNQEQAPVLHVLEESVPARANQRND